MDLRVRTDQQVVGRFEKCPVMDNQDLRQTVVVYYPLPEPRGLRVVIGEILKLCRPRWSDVMMGVICIRKLQGSRE
jgi:hypothetical protein